jgi:hypothetical protein
MKKMSAKNGKRFFATITCAYQGGGVVPQVNNETIGYQ